MDSFSIGLVNRAVSVFFVFITVLLFLIVTGLTSACAGDAQKEPGPDVNANSAPQADIVAEVEGRTISTGELLSQYNLYFIISRFSRTYKTGLTVNTYLDHYISELLLLQEADKMGISVTQDEVEKEKQRYLKLFRFDSEEILIKWLKSKTLTIEDAENYFRNSLILKKFYNREFGKKKISEAESAKYYDENNKYYNRPAKIRASHILICHTGSQGCSSSLSKEKAKELAESVQKLATPDNFATLASRYSFDITGRSGGSLGEITKGTAVPAFEDAAFSLEEGEISGIVETNYGYHIIYVSDKTDEVSISLEEARKSIEYTLEKEQIDAELFKYSEQLLKTAKIKKYGEEDRKEEVKKSKTPAGEKKEKKSVKQYSTFKPTGKGIYKNSKGQPVILLFTRKGCHFCEWVEETFEEVVSEYVEKGLIEAHHYDYNEKDDFLTPEKEAYIPPEYLKFFEFENSTKSTPYFYFAGMYYRRGAGYYEQDDLYAEEMEMKQIIDDLLR